jgi:enterochelin esterase-like enzyme
MRENERYRIDQVHATSLENNPLNNPVGRNLHIYLPPDYFESKTQRYPVIYLLHGYSGHHQMLIVYPQLKEMKYFSVEQLPQHLLDKVDLSRLPTFEQFDQLVAQSDLAPFILVQPDASLHVPHKEGVTDSTGALFLKGSFFLNSPFTGNYADYIVNDILTHVDTSYRTIPS